MSFVTAAQLLVVEALNKKNAPVSVSELARLLRVSTDEEGRALHDALNALAIQGTVELLPGGIGEDGLAEPERWVLR